MSFRHKVVLRSKYREGYVIYESNIRVDLLDVGVNLELKLSVVEKKRNIIVMSKSAIRIPNSKFRWRSAAAVQTLPKYSSPSVRQTLIVTGRTMYCGGKPKIAVVKESARLANKLWTLQCKLFKKFNSSSTLGGRTSQYSK